MTEIALTKGHVALVDDADAERVLQHKWRAMVRRNGTAYAVRTLPWVDGKRPCQLMHRFIMGARDGEDVDHRDGNGLNNQRANLRACSRTQNLGNSKRYRNNTSGLKGAAYNSRLGRYTASITVSGRTRYLGSFITPLEAHAAYNEAAAEAFGEFARSE